MSDFKAKMHPIRWGSLQHSSDPQLDLRGPTSKGREGRVRKEKGWNRKRREGKGADAMGGEWPPFWNPKYATANAYN